LSFKFAAMLFLVVFGAVFGALWLDKRFDRPTPTQATGSVPLAADGSPFDFTVAAQKAVPSVVSIDAAMRTSTFFGESSLTSVGSGSGVVVQSDGYIVTNAHVVRNPMQRGKAVAADVVKVRTSDGKGYDAKVVGIDPTSDLAVLKVEAANLVPATFGDSENIQIGDWVVAVGNQLGFDNSVSVGVVSSKNRWLDSRETDTVLIDAIQTDATINRGNSGGALCNLQGEVVGINSSIATMDGVYSGVGFAIPTKHVTRVVKDIIDHGFVRYASLGLTLFRTTFSLSVPQDRQYLREVTGANSDPPDYGVVVDEVQPGSPAAESKIRQLDVLLEIDGRRMYSNIDFVRETMEKRPGDEVEIKIWSRGQTKTLKVVLGSQSP
jgi:S1-C subfamily serine protease